MKLSLHLFAFLCLFIFRGFSQDKTTARFGKVTADDFKTAVYSIDSNAAAVIIADVGSSEFVGNSSNNFSLLFKNYRRAHIINKNGYDVGDIEIRLYNNGTSEEELQGLKAVTYNLENGKVVETKLDSKSGVFTDKKSKSWTYRKFTFPNIKAGSIIEYEYEIKSDFVFNLRPWEFQDKYPRLWSEYKVEMPEFYHYVTLTQGYQLPFIKTQKSRQEHFIVSDTRGTGASDRSAFNAGVTDYRWVMKDVPALKEEKFTSTLDNHINRIEFQLASLRDPFVPKTIMGTWQDVAKDMLEDEDFGLNLRKDNGWLNDVMDLAVRKTDNDLQKAKHIYEWVRDNITCTQSSATHLSQTLKNVIKNKNGNVAEVNLLLTAMLLKADLDAAPIILSTRSNGYTHSIYPLMDHFNYVISTVKLNGVDYYLDASESQMPFGKLDYECYNGHARIVNRAATPIDLSADSLKELSITSVLVINDDKGNSIGAFQQAPGFYRSISLRNSIRAKGIAELQKNIQKDFGDEAVISNLRLDSLTKLDEPLAMQYDFDLNTDKPDIMYVSPMFGEGYKENPFKSAQRFYPVEMPYRVDDMYILQMEVPAGYEVDELPKSTVVKLNEQGDATFEYRVSLQNNTIYLRSRLMTQRTWFAPDEYDMLREFFSIIVKLHNEQIVFKKKK